jgi:tRNA wybutosine-synthesizing protein 4
VKFVDIDYKTLLVRKRDIIKNNVELSGMLTNLICLEDNFLLLQSDLYLQIGCDLRELSNLSSALGSATDLKSSLVLCVAEVSITYMDVEAADALIRWVGGLPDGEQHPTQVLFCVDDIG